MGKLGEFEVCKGVEVFTSLLVYYSLIDTILRSVWVEINGHIFLVSDHTVLRNVLEHLARDG